MITRETMEAQRDEYTASPLPAQLERIVSNLERIVAGLTEPVSLAPARDRIDENMAYTEWTGLSIGDSTLLEVLLECHRLMGRLRHDWASVVASPELRAWVCRDVAAVRDTILSNAHDVPA